YGFGFQFLQLFCTRIFVMPTSSAKLVYVYWNLQVIYKNNDKKIGEVEDESVWLSDIEQEVNNEETNF
ncbi:14451_t:CDS:2, partial [Cetraspora pellucida]